MSSFADKLITWFLISARDLPWRQTRDPYLIWISEVILQQTRVQQGMDYYFRFTSRFPDVKSLAEADEEEVLSLWQGLGYYSRARNLHAAARFVENECRGVFPDTFSSLQKLKGVGAYTAAAIASFAFGENVPVVDGNVLRVFCRYFALSEDIRLESTQDSVRTLAAGLLPEGKSWEFNQAIMELGALVCKPGIPDCSGCPLVSGCQAAATGLQASLPFKSKAKERRARFFNYLWPVSEGRMAFRKREEDDIWKGLFEPLLFEADKNFIRPEDFPEEAAAYFKNAARCRLLPAEKCILSHQEIFLSIWLVELPSGQENTGIRWLSATEAEDLPKPVIFSKILRKARTSPLYLIP